MRTLKHMSFKGILIKHQIFKTKFEGNLWQLEWRINNQILGVKGLLDCRNLIIEFITTSKQSLMITNKDIWIKMVYIN